MTLLSVLDQTPVIDGHTAADAIAATVELAQLADDLGYTRYDIMAQGLGCYGEYVEQPEDIRPALERAQKKVDDGMVALVNVKTDYRARATTVRFSSRET